MITRKCIIVIIGMFKFYLYKMIQANNLKKIFTLFPRKTITKLPTNFKRMDTININETYTKS